METPGGDSDDALAVERGRDGASHMRAVPILPRVMEGGVAVAEVPAVDIVDEAVAVVIKPVRGEAAGFAGVGPGSTGQIRVAEVDTVVDDGTTTSLRPIPRLSA